jgi:hypothetical protein
MLFSKKKKNHTNTKATVSSRVVAHSKVDSEYDFEVMIFTLGRVQKLAYFAQTSDIEGI